jgi:hypothetical protein
VNNVFISNTIAGFGFATGVYCASLLFLPIIDLMTDCIPTRKVEYVTIANCKYSNNDAIGDDVVVDSVGDDAVGYDENAY